MVFQLYVELWRRLYGFYEFVEASGITEFQKVITTFQKLAKRNSKQLCVWLSQWINARD